MTVHFFFKEKKINYDGVTQKTSIWKAMFLCRDTPLATSRNQCSGKAAPDSGCCSAEGCSWTGWKWGDRGASAWPERSVASFPTFILSIRPRFVCFEQSPNTYFYYLMTRFHIKVLFLPTEKFKCMTISFS